MREAIARAGELDCLRLWRLPAGWDAYSHRHLGRGLRERAHTCENFKLFWLARLPDHVLFRFDGERDGGNQSQRVAQHADGGGVEARDWRGENEGGGFPPPRPRAG